MNISTVNTDILKVVEICGFVIGYFFLLLEVIKRSNQKFNEVKKKFQESYVKKTQRKYVADYIGIPLAKKIDDNYKYSRFFAKKGIHTYLKTSLGYFVVSIITSIVVMIAFYFFTKSPLVAIVGFVGSEMAFFLRLYFMRYMNNKNVESDLITFLNLLGNYSTSSTEIMSIFLQIAPKVKDPLRSCLIECVNESHNSETTIDSVLRNLENKIENPDFKEIIENIIVSIKYSSGFVTLCNNERKILTISIVGKNTIKSCVQNNTRIMCVCLVMLMAMMFPLGTLLDMNIVSFTLTNILGHLYLIIIAVCVLIYIVDLLRVDRG